MRGRILSKIALAVGILLFIAAAAGFIFIKLREENTAMRGEEIAARIETALPEKIAGVAEQRADNDMPVMELDGTDFVGMLELAGRHYKQPVAAQWDTSLFAYRPARFTGSVYDGSLVIGGDFDFAGEIDAGEQITFTDMTGRAFSYTATHISHAQSADAQSLTSKEGALTLFTKKDGAYLIITCEFLA